MNTPTTYNPMTAANPNPYWALIRGLITIDPFGRRVAAHPAHWDPWVPTFAWQYRTMFSNAITDPTTIAFIAEQARERKVAHVAAGNGYWARQLKHAGVKIQASALVPPGNDYTTETQAVNAPPRRWHPVVRRSPARHAATAGRERAVLMMCWPPYNAMAADALAAYASNGGDTLVYIGERRGDACADDRFFDTLDADWVMTACAMSHPSWFDTHDRCQIWTRRSGAEVSDAPRRRSAVAYMAAR